MPKAGRYRVGLGYGERCPLSRSVVSSPSLVRGRAPAGNGFWRTLKATYAPFCTYMTNSGYGQFALASPLQILGDLSLAPSPVIYVMVRTADNLVAVTNLWRAVWRGCDDIKSLRKSTVEYLFVFLLVQKSFKNCHIWHVFTAHSVLRRYLSRSANIIFFAANVINATLRCEDVDCVINSLRLW